MFTPEQLDHEYNARAAIPDHPQIFSGWSEDSEAACGHPLFHATLRLLGDPR